MKASDILKLKSVPQQLKLLEQNCNSMTVGDIQEMRDFYNNHHKILDDEEKEDYYITQKEIDNDNITIEKIHTMHHAKLCIPYAQQIITNMVAFLYGKDIDLVLKDNREDPETEEAFKKFQEIWTDDIRMMSILREATKDCGINTRAAIQFLWDKEGKKIKAKVLAQKDNGNGYDIYRHKDDFNKVDAVVTKYKMDKIIDGVLSQDVSTIDIWTKEGLIRYSAGKSEDPEIVENPQKTNKKLLFVYLEQSQTEFAPVIDIINNEDYARSQHSDVNVKIGSPVMVVNGHIATKPLCNSTIQIYEITAADNFDSSKSSTNDMKYLELSSAPESVKLEMENNEKDIYRFTYPDLSALLSESNFGNLSGKSIQLMFVQAFVKLAEKKVIHDDIISRSISIIKALATDLYSEYPAMKNLKIGYNYNSILPSTDSDKVTMLAAAVTAGITSQENAVKILSFNTPETMKEINEEKLKLAIKNVNLQDSASGTETETGTETSLPKKINPDAASGNTRNAAGVNGN